jgi:hypothetical protein
MFQLIHSTFIALTAAFFWATPFDSLYAQEKFNVSLGVGVPEFFYVGGRYQIRQTQLGLGMGLINAPELSLISFTADAYYHFAGTSSLAQRKLWFARTGLFFIRDDNEHAVNDLLYLNLRLGRDINLTRKFGLAVDAGAIFLILRETHKKNPRGWNFVFPVLPAFGIGAYYRI